MKLTLPLGLELEQLPLEFHHFRSGLRELLLGRPCDFASDGNQFNFNYVHDDILLRDEFERCVLSAEFA